MGIFAGKSSSKWRKRAAAGEDLASEARGVAKARKETAPSGEAASMKKGFIGKSIEKLRKKKEQDRRRNARNRGMEATEPCEESPWHAKTVRVSSETIHEGSKGFVSSVSRYPSTDKYRLQLREETDADKTRMILVDSDEVVLEDDRWLEPKPMLLDYRKCTLERRLQLADQMAISAVEKVRSDTKLPKPWQNNGKTFAKP